jgi:ATP-binding cassette subfamily G (WHITE) protein 1
MSTVEPLDLVFTNLSYNVKDKAESKIQKKVVNKTILDDLSGYFIHGRLTGIMGPSGAGKTSLMEVISNQSKSGEVQGNLYLNGNEVDIEKIKKISGFVFQDDIILRTMTVYEALYMSALLKLPENISIEDKKNIVNEMISILNLEKCKNTIVGDITIKGISGGERKRLSVGMEMITNPSIIFLDEPTSGLDTYTAYSLVKNLKNLTETGRTVVATIHQPSSDILRLFDDIILLNHGKIVYQGEVNNLVKYFDNIGYKCPEYTNPSDFIFMNILNPIDLKNNNDETNINIEQLNVQYNKDEKPITNIEKKDKFILDSYKKSGMENEVKKKCDEINSNIKNLSEKNVKYVARIGLQYKFLLKRHFKNIIRDKAILRTKLGQSFILGLVIGLTFLNIPSREEKVQIQDRNGSLFMSCFSQVLFPIVGTLAIFSLETPIVMREIGSGYYTPLGYFLSKISIEIPFQMIITFITCTIIYWLVSFQKKFKKYITFVGIIELGSLCGLSIGMTIATIAKNVSIALQFAPFCIIPFILFSGLFINTNSIPAYFTWIQYLSPIRYMYQEVYKNEFKGLQYKGIYLDYSIDQMNFYKLSTALALSLITLLIIIFYSLCYLVLFLSIKKSLSKTKYFLNEKTELKTDEFSEHNNIK